MCLERLHGEWLLLKWRAAANVCLELVLVESSVYIGSADVRLERALVESSFYMGDGGVYVL